MHFCNTESNHRMNEICNNSDTAENFEGCPCAITWPKCHVVKSGMLAWNCLGGILQKKLNPFLPSRPFRTSETERSQPNFGVPFTRRCLYSFGFARCVPVVPYSWVVSNHWFGWIGVGQLEIISNLGTGSRTLSQFSIIKHVAGASVRHQFIMKAEDIVIVVKGASLPGGPSPSSAPAPGRDTATTQTVRKKSWKNKSIREVAIDVATCVDSIRPDYVGLLMIASAAGLMCQSESPLAGRLAKILFVMGGIMFLCSVLEFLADLWWLWYTRAPVSDDVRPSEFNGRARVFSGLLLVIAEGRLWRGTLRSVLNQASFARGSRNYLDPLNYTYAYMFAAYVDLLMMTGVLFAVWYVLMGLCASCGGLYVLVVSCWKATFRKKGKKKASIDCVV